MEILLIVLFAILGLAIGSFLNVCIDRLPQNKSIVFPPSHCEACQHKLAIKDNIPVFSYLRLRGRCRYCQAAIPKRLFWVEFATALIFVFLYWWCVILNQNQELGIVAFGVMAFYASLFIVIFVIDLEQGLILDKVVYPTMVVAFLLALYPWPWLNDSIGMRLAYAALGGAVGFVIFLLIHIISPDGMAWGDVQLAALVGLATGFPLVILAVIMGAILGGIIAVALVIAKRKKLKEGIPYGPFLAAATMITLLWGNQIISWWIGVIQGRLTFL